MEAAFAWLGQIIQALGSLIPRLVLVRATHGGVKWRWGRRVRAMAPGLHIVWPVTTEHEIIVTARQTLNLPTQVLTTWDQQRVVLGAVVVYRICDIVQAIGERNWDVDTTIRDIGQAAIVSVISKLTLTELLAGIADDSITQQLTQACRRELRKFGVRVGRCSIVDVAQCDVRKLVWEPPVGAPTTYQPIGY